MRSVITAALSLRAVSWLVDFLLVGYALTRVTGWIVGAKGGDAEAWLWWVLLLSYFLVSETLTQRTIGKLLTNTIVIREDGGKPTVMQLALRTICRFIPFNPLSGLFSSDRVFWHDYLSKTRVVSRGTLKSDGTGTA